jgi:hypothetical protein
MLADRHEWRFYIMDFEPTPYSIKRASKVIKVNTTEGTIDFLVNLKEG